MQPRISSERMKTLQILHQNGIFSIAFFFHQYNQFRPPLTKLLFHAKHLGGWRFWGIFGVEAQKFAKIAITQNLVVHMRTKKRAGFYHWESPKKIWQLFMPWIFLLSASKIAENFKIGVFQCFSVWFKHWKTPILKFSAIFEPLSRKIHGRNIFQNFVGDSWSLFLDPFLVRKWPSRFWIISILANFWASIPKIPQNRHPPKCFAWFRSQKLGWGKPSWGPPSCFQPFTQIWGFQSDHWNSSKGRAKNAQQNAAGEE